FLTMSYSYCCDSVWLFLSLPTRRSSDLTKADILSLTAFEIGLFGWMALMTFVFFTDPHLEPNSPVYWFMMQLGMILGFVTAWPADRKSTRLNSSHVSTSYAVFCLKKQN